MANADLFADKIDAILDAMYAIAVATAPTALVLTQFQFDPNADNWAGMLKSPLDLVDGEPRVHAIQIYHNGIDEDEDEPAGSLDPVLTFGFDFFHLYDVGTITDNSSKRITREIARVKWNLAASTNLGMNEVPDTHPGYASVMGHNGLRVPPPYRFKQFGETPVQYGLGQIVVRMQSQYVRGQ